MLNALNGIRERGCADSVVNELMEKLENEVIERMT